VPSIFPFKSAQQVKCRSTRNSNKPEEMTEDASDSDEMQVEEAVAHCTSCQHRISELEKTVEALREQVKQFSRKFDELRAENNELRAENNELRTENNKLKTRIDVMREEMTGEINSYKCKEKFVILQAIGII